MKSGGGTARDTVSKPDGRSLFGEFDWGSGKVKYSPLTLYVEQPRLEIVKNGAGVAYIPK